MERHPKTSGKRGTDLLPPVFSPDPVKDQKPPPDLSKLKAAYQGLSMGGPGKHPGDGSPVEAGSRRFLARRDRAAQGERRVKTETIKASTFLAVVLGVLFTVQARAGDSQDLQSELRQRRNAIMESMAHKGMLILFSGLPKSYSGDVEYEYRQENNFHYLTGLHQANSTLVLMPQNEKYREILFVPEKDSLRELWTGKMLSQQEARDLSGIETVWRASRFDAFLDRVLYGRPYGAGRYSDSQEYRGFFADLARGEAEIFLLLEPKPGLKGQLGQSHVFAERLRERFGGITIRDVAPQTSPAADEQVGLRTEPTAQSHRHHR